MWISHPKPPPSNHLPNPPCHGGPQHPQRRVAGGCAAPRTPVPPPQRSRDVSPPFVTGSRAHSQGDDTPFQGRGASGGEGPRRSATPGRLREVCRGKVPSRSHQPLPEPLEDSLGQFQSIFTKKKQIWAGETVFLPAPGCQQHPDFIGDPAAGSSRSWRCVTRPISVPLSVQHRGPRQRLLPAEPRKRPWRGAEPAETPAARAGAPSPVSLRGCFAPHGCLLEQGQRVPLLHPPQLLLLRPFELQRVPNLWEEGRRGFQGTETVPERARRDRDSRAPSFPPLWHSQSQAPRHMLWNGIFFLLLLLKQQT